jgi:hypothetical protein
VGLAAILIARPLQRRLGSALAPLADTGAGEDRG